ncbi:hypothetical protein FI667_g1460, partial [Globisporangium splendens]
MVRFVQQALGAALALTASLVAAAADGVEVHIMSFNIRTSDASGDAGGTCSNWNGVRKDNVVAEIKSVMPDFFGTQETSDAQKAYLDSQLADTYVSIGTSTGSLNGAASEVDALYYKTAVWKLITNGQFWYGPNPDAMSAAWNMQYYRTGVWGRFEHIASGQTACIMNTHYETPGNDEAQIQASNILLAKIDALCQATDKLIVVTGDFNALPNYPAIVKLLQNDLAEPTLDPTFCGDMLSPTCQTKFDYTLHRLRDGACYKKSEVLRTAFNGCYPSDHAALLGTFCFGGSCCGDSSSSSSNSSSLAGSSAGTGAAGASSIGGEQNTSPGTVGPSTGSKASSSSSSDGATQVSTSKSETSSNPAGTVFLVLGTVGATAGVVVVVIRKKKELDEKVQGSKTDSAPFAPSYFSRVDDADNAALSPVASPRMSGPSPGRMSNSPGRLSNSPVPTLMATKRDSKRDSRSSSVSCTDLSPSHYNNVRTSSNASFGNDRISSPAMMGNESSIYSSSFSYSSGMNDSTINFSEAFAPESFDMDDDKLSQPKKTDFAML